VLTWSPVIRALFRLKRKSAPKIDEAQDGARAILIEEGITTWIFGQAVNLNPFADMKPGDLRFDLLNHVRQFVAGYGPSNVHSGCGRRPFSKAMQPSAFSVSIDAADCI
jgi:hypothetical protein